MDVEKLYYDKTLDDFIITQCWRKKLPYDDSKQDIFVQILESGAKTVGRCKQIANAYFRMQYYNKAKDDYIHELDIEQAGDYRDYSTAFDGET